MTTFPKWVAGVNAFVAALLVWMTVARDSIVDSIIDKWYERHSPFEVHLTESCTEYVLPLFDDRLGYFYPEFVIAKDCIVQPFDVWDLIREFYLLKPDGTKVVLTWLRDPETAQEFDSEITIRAGVIVNEEHMGFVIADLHEDLIDCVVKMTMPPYYLADKEFSIGETIQQGMSTWTKVGLCILVVLNLVTIVVLVRAQRRAALSTGSSQC